MTRVVSAPLEAPAPKAAPGKLLSPIVIGGEPPADDSESLTPREILEHVPAWLVSLVAHLVLVLMLALFTVATGGGSGGTNLVIDCGSQGTSEGEGDGLEDQAMLAANLEAPSELTTTPTVDALAPEQLALEPLAEAKPIDLVNPLANPAAGTNGAPGEGDHGSGLAQGDGNGKGVGDGYGLVPKLTSVFGLAAEAGTFVYVFDRSESMNSTLSFTSEGQTVFTVTPLQAAKAELLKSLDDLDRAQRFHIVFYNHEVWMFDPGRVGHNKLLPATRENKRRADNFVNSVYGEGNTKHVKPLEIALRMKPDVIFLLTDGEAKDDPTDVELARLKRINNGTTRINVIQFVYTPPVDGALVRLAKENDGKHIFFNINRLAPNVAALTK